MLDTKTGHQHVVELVAHVLRLCGSVSVTNHVRAECDMLGANIPDVQIVDAVDARDLNHVLADLLQRDAFRHSFIKDVKRFAGDAICPKEND